MSSPRNKYKNTKTQEDEKKDDDKKDDDKKEDEKKDDDKKDDDKKHDGDHHEPDTISLAEKVDGHAAKTVSMSATSFVGLGVLAFAGRLDHVPKNDSLANTC
jgi:hypothetical protein